MGIKNITAYDERDIINILQRWPLGRKLAWEELRKFISIKRNCNLNKIWTRQSLGNNDPIYTAFDVTKKRLIKNRMVNSTKAKSNEKYEEIIQRLQSELAETKIKYEALLLRHTQLSYNASQLENGNHLLIDPLPDNTRSQTG